MSVVESRLKYCVEQALLLGHNLPTYSGQWLAKTEHDSEYALGKIVTLVGELCGGYSCDLYDWLSEKTHITFISRTTYVDDWNEEEGEALVWYTGELLGSLGVEVDFDGREYRFRCNTPIVLKLLLDYHDETNNNNYNGDGVVENAWQDIEMQDAELFRELSR